MSGGQPNFARCLAVSGAATLFLPCGFYLSFCCFSLPNFSGRRLDIYHTSTVHTWCGLSAENTGRKNEAKNRHLGTIAQVVGIYLRN